MSNTVLIKGKGMTVAMMFYDLREWYKQGTLTQTFKWWQSEIRHELRLQNLTPEEIHQLQLLLPVSKYKIEIF